MTWDSKFGCSNVVEIPGVSWGLADFPALHLRAEPCSGTSGFLRSWKSFSVATQPDD